METLIKQSKSIVKQLLETRMFVQKSGKVIGRLCNIALCITMITPFFFVAKMYVVSVIFCMCIIVILILINTIQKECDIYIKVLKKRINEF